MTSVLLSLCQEYKKLNRNLHKDNRNNLKGKASFQVYFKELIVFDLGANIHRKRTNSKDR